MGRFPRFLLIFQRCSWHLLNTATWWVLAKEFTSLHCHHRKRRKKNRQAIPMYHDTVQVSYYKKSFRVIWLWYGRKKLNAGGGEGGVRRFHFTSWTTCTGIIFLVYHIVGLYSYSTGTWVWYCAWGVKYNLVISPFSTLSLFNFKVILISTGCTVLGGRRWGRSKTVWRKKRLAGLGWWVGAQYRLWEITETVELENYFCLSWWILEI